MDQILYLSGVAAVPWAEIGAIAVGFVILLKGQLVPDDSSPEPANFLIALGALAIFFGLPLGVTQIDSKLWDFVYVLLGAAITGVLIALPPGPVMFLGFLFYLGPPLLLAGASTGLRRCLVRHRIQKSFIKKGTTPGPQRRDSIPASTPSQHD
ncbi:hypothetical protein CATRI_05975 [Corynebacterium atrinae]|uniref:hypothetical protein n=1 Tax=Corynebacterium atrinae TaxID=1336740 RepID=UPI0025B57895|nr:hypothetical protein [Corynebacterium atrinae]WJY63283.1 hypothetical protein CATRI_05975 [Corynebacterium atrinae]